LIEQGKAHTRIYDDDDDKSTNFEKWNIHSKISQQSLQKFINFKIINNQYIYFINNDNFGLKMKNVIRECLLQETRFHSNAENYIIYVNYYFIDTKKVDIEIIWSLSDNEYQNNKKDFFFYDKFELFLHN
jgi:hypothetical protein